MHEEQLTNLMYELLSPVENPERWRLYLELFDKHVLRLNMTDTELDSAEVIGKVVTGKKEQYRTEFISTSRPIDLVIITNKRFIPIEVKIGDDYTEQEKQCYDYWREAEEYHKQHALIEPPVLYYLTPEGDSPSRYSAGDFGFENNSNCFIRSDKIDAVAFCSEGFSWIVDCEDSPPKDISHKNNLKRVYYEIDKMANKRTNSQRQVKDIMWKFFTALDKCFDENFCENYHLKRGGNKRIEVGDAYDYKRFIDRFFGKAFSWPSICLQCTDAAGNVIKLDDDKELWFRVGCYNDRYNYLNESMAFCAGFIIFSHRIKEGLYKDKEITPLLNGKNILPQKFVNEYKQEFDGLVGRTELHDAHGNLIYFTDVDKTLRQFKNQQDIDSAVEHIMTEIKQLLERFVNG